MTKKRGMTKRTKRLLIFLATLASIMVAWVAYMYAVHIRYNGSVENISIQSGDVTLRGWFVKPEGKGPHPAVIILHGSGPCAGDALPARIQINAFLRSGVSVLTYDKRGVGGSGGDFVRTGYQDFIKDGISAVRYLKSRSDVADGGIGLSSNSESGWFTPEIANRTGDVSFIINRAPSALPWIETNLWEIRHELMDEGVDGGALEAAIRIRGMAWHFIVEVAADPSLVGGEKWQRIDADLAEFDRLYGNTAAWFWMKKLPDYDQAFYRRKAAFMGYDPQPHIEQLEVPVLNIFAENDEVMPTAASVAYLQTLPTQEGRDIENRVIPGVKHDMLSAAALLSGSDPAFIDVIGPWAAAKSRERPD
jgi:pimeloyl-ACP methyl ester carboxylesterase